jgi:hypothetical protein
MPCGVCGVTKRIKGIFVVDVNSELSGVVCCDEETYAVLLCSAPSDVKHVDAPSEVHCCPPFRRGGTLIFVFHCLAPSKIVAKRLEASVCASPT